MPLIILLIISYSLSLIYTLSYLYIYISIRIIKFFFYVKVWSIGSIGTAEDSDGALELGLTLDYNNLTLYYL